MAIAQQNRFEMVPGGLAGSPARSDAAILIGYAAFAAALLVAIYFGSMSSGTAAAELAVMAVFP